MSTERAARKVRTGVVVSVSGDKSVTVEVTDAVLHQKYQKTIPRRKRLHAHIEGDDAKVGDTVRVTETRPLSKTKRWRVSEIIERAR